MIQPTATGKSTEAAFIARSCILLHDMKGIYLYDENDGLHQARKNFEYIFNKNKVKCANFFGNTKDYDATEANLVFASFQSMNNYHEKWYKMFDKDHFDFMLVNEAHHSQAPTYRPVVEYFTCPHIGFTGTPDRMDGLDLLEIFDRVLVNMPLEVAIAKGYVVNQIEYNVFGHNLSSKKLKSLVSEYREEGKKISIKQINESIFIDELDEEMLEKVYEYAFPENEAARQVKIFCENIEHANRITTRIQQDGHKAEVAHSGMSANHNTHVLGSFRENKIQFLVSVDKYNEDIDISNIEVVVFFRNTDSLTVFLQQLGRGLRKGKPKLYVLDFVGNAERMLLLSGLEERIMSYVKGLPLDKNRIDIASLGFKLKWHGYSPDVLKLLQAIQYGKYKTCQEASLAAKNLGIETSTVYFTRYLEDPRLPSPASLSKYSGFLGWPEFFGKERHPKGWMSMAMLSKDTTISALKAKIKNFIEPFRLTNPLFFKIFWTNLGYKEHYHPKLVKKIRREFPFYGFAPDNWRSITEIKSQLKDSIFTVGIYTLRKLANQYAEEYTNQKKMFNSRVSSRVGGRITYHYGPKVLKKVLRSISELYGPKSWITSRNVASLFKGFGIKDIQERSKVLAQGKSWIKKDSRGGHIVEIYHPDLVRELNKHFPSYGPPLKGWKTPTFLYEIEGVSSELTIRNFVDQYRVTNPEWFKLFLIAGKHIVEHYHPTLVKKIYTEFSVKEITPSGWLTTTGIKKKFSIAIEISKKVSKKYRTEKSHWFKEFPKKGILREHLHPDLIKKIQEYYFVHSKKRKK